MISIIGLGPGDMSYLTLEAMDAINAADKLICRTEKHACISSLRQSYNVESFDYLYEKADSFEEVYDAIVSNVLERHDELRIKKGDDALLAYLVPGSPVVFEKTVSMLSARLEPKSHSIVHGVSFLDIMMTKLNIDPLGGLSVVDALSLKDEPKTRRGKLIIAQCYDRLIASDCKLWLGDIIEDEDRVLVCTSLGCAGKERIEELPLYKLDRKDIFNHETSIVASVKSL